MATRLSYLLAGPSLLVIASAALAQPAAPNAEGVAQRANQAQAEAGQGDEIIVTARRRDERLQDVPQVITALTSEQLTKQNIRNFQDIQTLVPGLQIKMEANGIGSGAQIRGVQFDPNTGSTATVQLYLNDVPVDSTVLQTMYDIGQVEVQRGPQGTLRGEAAPSGSIAITTKRPDLQEAGGYLSATGNDIGTLNFNGGFGVPIIKGIAALRIAGAYDANEGNRVRTIERVGDARDPYSRSWSGRVSLLVEPADWIRLSGIYQRYERKSRSFAQYESFSLANPAAPASPRLITPGQRLSIQENPSILSQVANSYNWRGEFRAAGQVLIYQGAHLAFDLTNLGNSDAANFIKGRDFFQNTHTSAWSWIHELRLQNEKRVLGMFDYVIGAFDSRFKPTTNLTIQTPVFLPPAFGGGLVAIANTPINIPGTVVHEQSFFGNLTAHIGDATEISGGLRHIKFTQPNGALIIAGNSIATQGFNDEGTIYVASIKHNFTPNLMVYASTGTSRRPGPNVIGDFSVSRSALENSFLFLPAETSRSYEIGLKSSWLNKRLHFNVTGFHQTFKNYPYRNPTGVYYVSNSATVSGGVVTITPTVSNFNFVSPVPVEVNGVEAELSFDVTPNWNVNILAAYALGKIKNGLVACNDINNDGIPDTVITQPTLIALQNRVGANHLATCRVTQRSAFQSPLTATVQTEYHLPISEHVDAFGRGLFSFYGNSQGDPTFAFDQVKPYGLLNLFFGIRDPKGMWEVSLYGKNVLNKTKVISVGLPATTSYQQLNTSFVPSSATFTSTYSVIGTTPLREFGLTVRYAFGSR